MIENLYKVSKRQWKKWNEQEQELFNDLFLDIEFHQHRYKHPKADFIPPDYWKTTAWNAAWMAADYLRTYRKRK